VNFDTLLSDLRRDEGWRESAYEDSLGFLTIGYGFLIDARKGGALPRAIGDAWLEHAAQARWSALLAELPWLETQPEAVQRALANMAYQLGCGGVMRFRKMLAALERGDRQKAADEALDSTWARVQTPNRAQRVAALIRG